jgi:L-threonylcarbamoyladenylate synthase
VAGTNQHIAQAVERLRSGGVVAFPTETVYGLGACALNASAVRRVFELKGRPAHNPLIVHVSGAEMARRVVRSWPTQAECLAASFWPGPLTLVLPKAESVPEVVTGGPGSVNIAVRCPDHPLTLALLAELGEPIVGPSANRSGYVSPTTAQHVRDEFPSEHDVLVLESAMHGASRVGLESTVLSLAGVRPTILRAGIITRFDIARALGVADDAIATSPQDREDGGGSGGRETGSGPNPGTSPKPLDSPGLLARHYAPRTPAVLADRATILDSLRRSSSPIVVLARSPITAVKPHQAIPMPQGPEPYAAALYAALRAADTLAASRIMIEAPPLHTPGQDARDRAIWEAIMDRLARAVTPE